MLKLLAAYGLALLFFSLTSLSLCSYHNTRKQFDVQPLPNDDDVYTLRTGLDAGLKCIYPTDCNDVMECGLKISGAYRVFPAGVGDGFLVHCDMQTEGGGWLVFQRRQDGSVDFYRNWKNYTNGFGNLLGEFWLGLEKLHLLTSQRHYDLLVNLGSYDNGTRFAYYNRFYISDESHQFQLLLGPYEGDAGDSLSYHNGYKFSTFDLREDGGCARLYKGAWWYVDCHRANLNGPYISVANHTQNNPYSLSWYHWTNAHKPMQFVEMKIRSFQ